jgi:hypothetical protein
MEQAMASPITADQREGCIAELKRDNQRELSNFELRLFFGSLSPLMWIGMWSMIHTDPYSMTLPDALSDYVPVACWAMVAAGACYAVFVWATLQWISETMRKYAATVFTETDLVNYVLNLPSDVQAYRGRIRAAFVGEWLTFKKERFDARRRAKAIIMRFGTWCRRYHRLSELWPVGGAIYIFGGTLIAVFATSLWLVSQPDLKQFLERSQYLAFCDVSFGYWVLSMLLIIVLEAVTLGRRYGSRLALIEYFQAEAARGDVGEAEDGTSNG